MNKQDFNDEINKIEFPRNEVMNAINNGIKKGRRKKGLRNKSGLKKVVAASSIAASALLVSGLLFAPVTNVLASVPIIGAIYDRFSMQIGYELFESNLITQINDEAKSNGIEITITSAYYDGNVIGLTFKAEGDRVSLDRIGEQEEPEVGYSFHLSDGDEQKQWSSSMTTGLEKTSDGYVGAMEFDNPNADLPEDYTLPLTFTSVTGVKGIWKFDVPVKQIPSETIAVKGESISKENKDYSIHIESVTKGKATTFLDYKTTFPLDGKNDEINLTVFDDKGNRLSKSHADVLSVDQSNGLVENDYRELFSSKIAKNTEYLTIQPEIRKDEVDTLISLDKRTPFVVDSNRFEYKIQVNHIKQNENQLILDYDIQNVDSEELGKDIVQNFADFIMLIKSDNIHKDDVGQLDMNQMIDHQIRSNQAKEIDDDYPHFQSVFTINNVKELNIKDYSLTVPFGILSRNTPIEMEPVIVELK
ncbi:DUF4179 domain-containing protein [Terribacillus saccharophilus]|uniref:DUF4179 domain-containing protein n=1 Tax=Terribacillus saccharophilus TaxID=361277 RepID=A0A268AG51_9BACI|nr:DUF4179 domain-containing protein [Terribacillus saccharophilus]PAD23098.1 hypothetical protein CHH64_00335 [Terribacillus saccharophilus]